MRLTPRKRFLVDPRLQFSLLLRTFGYWCFCVITTGVILLCWNAAFGPERTFLAYFDFGNLWREHGTVMIAAIIMLPVLLIDVLLTTNRFAGPLYRLRRSLRAMAVGERVEPVQFRETDFWHEVAQECNAVGTYIDLLKRDAANAARLERKGDQGETFEFESLGRR